MKTHLNQQRLAKKIMATLLILESTIGIGANPDQKTENPPSEEGLIERAGDLDKTIYFDQYLEPYLITSGMGMLTVKKIIKKKSSTYLRQNNEISKSLVNPIEKIDEIENNTFKSVNQVALKQTLRPYVEVMETEHIIAENSTNKGLLNHLRTLKPITIENKMVRKNLTWLQGLEQNQETSKQLIELRVSTAENLAIQNPGKPLSEYKLITKNHLIKGTPAEVIEKFKLFISENHKIIGWTSGYYNSNSPNSVAIVSRTQLDAQKLRIQQHNEKINTINENNTKAHRLNLSAGRLNKIGWGLVILGGVFGYTAIDKAMERWLSTDAPEELSSDKSDIKMRWITFLSSYNYHLTNPITATNTDPSNLDEVLPPNLSSPTVLSPPPAQSDNKTLAEPNNPSVKNEIPQEEEEQNRQEQQEPQNQQQEALDSLDGTPGSQIPENEELR